MTLADNAKQMYFTFFHHPDEHALLEAAVLASVSPAFVNRTVFVR